MRNYDLSPLFRQWIGFDKLANTMKISSEPQGFPPYNIEKKDDNHYSISLALPGFKPDNLQIEVEGPRLIIRGKLEQEERDNHKECPYGQGQEQESEKKKQPQYLHQGIVRKEFELTFTLAEHLHVNDAKLDHGLLHIDLLRHTPEPRQPQRIPINSDKQP